MPRCILSYEKIMKNLVKRAKREVFSFSSMKILCKTERFLLYPRIIAAPYQGTLNLLRCILSYVGTQKIRRIKKKLRMKLDNWLLRHTAFISRECPRVSSSAGSRTDLPSGCMRARWWCGATSSSVRATPRRGADICRE